MLPRLPTTALLLTTALAALCAACTAPRPRERPLTSADSSVVDTTRLNPIAAAYHDRLRLGLGSPFRLIEIVLRDDRLGKARSLVAHSLMQALHDGDAYQLTPLMLVDAGVDSTSAIAQLDLIRETIERAANPRIGELAVNLAYQQVVRDSVVSELAAERVFAISALLRDRQLALADARRLARAARQLGVQEHELVLKWRRERRFTVEQPTVTPLAVNERTTAANLALLLTGGIRAAAAPAPSVLNRRLEAWSTALTIADAERLRVDSTQNSPVPQSALTIVLRAIAKGAEHTPARLNAPHWQQFFAHVADEEGLVAALQHTRIASADDHVAAGIALSAAVALRPFAQEQLAVIDSLAPQHLRERFGVRVRMGGTLTPATRAHALTDLFNALLDLRVAIPTIDVRGLTFDIRTIAANARYQAYHDPRNRVIRIDPAAAAGMLAHEIAHDVDWQLARRKYQVRAGYATDYAVRKRKALAYQLTSLRSDDRPAEAFARRFEWYVVSALAAQGRSNGFLSSVQSDWITGYGSAVRPEPDPLTRAAFAALLAQGTAMDRAAAAQAEQLIADGGTACGEELLVIGPRAHGNAAYQLVDLFATGAELLADACSHGAFLP